MGAMAIPEILNGASVAALCKVTRGAGLFGYGIRALTENKTFCGRAVTALCPNGDNGALHLAIAKAEPGDVIVALTAGPVTVGMWGGISSVAARGRDIGALVLDGYVTDLGEIRDSGFCVFARGSSAYPPVRKTRGELNIPILIEGIIVKPGDIVIGDEDGVMAIHPDSIQDVAEGYVAQLKKEAAIIERVKAGEMTSVIFGVE